MVLIEFAVHFGASDRSGHHGNSHHFWNNDYMDMETAMVAVIMANKEDAVSETIIEM